MIARATAVPRQYRSAKLQGRSRAAARETGENLHGYLRRLTVANGHVNLSTFLGASGLLTGFGPLTVGSDYSRERFSPQGWWMIRRSATSSWTRRI